jgi:hypothetical protein
MKKWKITPNKSKKSRWNIIANDTDKIMSTFDMQVLAKQHYWVEKGWAKVVEAKPGDDIRESMMNLRTYIEDKLYEQLIESTEYKNLKSWENMVKSYGFKISKPSATKKGENNDGSFLVAKDKNGNMKGEWEISKGWLKESMKRES